METAKVVPAGNGGTEVETWTEPEPAASAAELVVGIARDSREILENYVELARLDMRHLLRAEMRTGLWLFVGATMVGIGLILGAHGLAWALALTTPLSLPGSLVAVALLLVVMGLPLLWISARRLKDPDRMPRAGREAKRDARWIKDNI